MSRFTGKVKWFNPSKGYGFVQPENGDKDIFVHVSEVERAGIRNLQEGQRLSFELENSRGKTAAIKLELV